MDPALKRRHLAACTTPDGIMCALAIDQGSSLTDALAAASSDGLDNHERAAQFKSGLARGLSPAASAILLDHRFGDACQAVCYDGTGILRAYESDVYGGASETVTMLPPDISAYRLARHGADAVKLHMYYDPDASEAENTIKQALIERVGAECQANDLPFLFEPLCYRRGLDPHTSTFAVAKPEMVRRLVEEFSRPRYCVDVLKIEFPVDLAFVAGTETADRQSRTPVYSKDQAMDHFRATAAVAACPFVFLSAGVTLDEFAEGLEMAGEAAVPYSGFLCGRAVWLPAIDIFGRGGPTALADWAKTEGQDRLRRLATIVTATAVPLDQTNRNADAHEPPAAGGRAR